MADQVKVGIIGAGGIARGAHIPGYQAQKDVEIVAICDVVAERAASVSEEFGIARSYGDYEEMLAQEDLDAVSVCTPNFKHKDATIAALQAGNNVLCEKPIAMNLEEGRAMVAAAESAGKLLQIGLHCRFGSEAQVLRRFMEAGDLGEIYYGESTMFRRRGIPGWGVFTQKALQGGGALIDIGVHTLDLTMWLMGNPKPVSVSGVTYTKFGKRKDIVTHWGMWDTEKFDVDDMGVGMVRFENGATLILRTTWAADIAGSFAENRILGTRGGGFMSPLSIHTEMHGELVDITPKETPKVEPHTQEIQHFVECIRGEHPCMVEPQQVLAVQAVLDAIYASSESGHEVVLDL